MGLSIISILLAYHTYKEVKIGQTLRTDMERLNIDKQGKNENTATCKLQVDEIKLKINSYVTEMEKVKDENSKLQEEVTVCQTEKTNVAAKIDSVKLKMGGGDIAVPDTPMVAE